MKKLTGMRDLTEVDSKKYLFFIKVASEEVQKYGFSFIKSPTLEEVSLFKRSAGEVTDVVSKEMYEFTDSNGTKIGLRPEGTAGVVRKYLESGMDKMKSRQKWFYYGNMFRYERPQKGRFREFNQFGCESFGEKSIYEDINILLMANRILEKLDIDATLKINSLGCPTCRAKYIEKLTAYLNKQEDMCDDCKVRKNSNPLRTLDCKIDSFKDAPLLIDNLCDSCNDSFNKVQEGLINNIVEFEIDSRLVRGLDYYNNLVFEFTTDKLGSQDAICGGGRYDSLTETLGGKPSPAIGFAFGVDRVMELLELDKERKQKFYICAMSEEYMNIALNLAQDYRKNFEVVLDYTFKSPMKQINKAEKQGCTDFILIGENEVKNLKYDIKKIQPKY